MKPYRITKEDEAFIEQQAVKAAGTLGWELEWADEMDQNNLPVTRPIGLINRNDVINRNAEAVYNSIQPIMKKRFEDNYQKGSKLSVLYLAKPSLMGEEVSLPGDVEIKGCAILLICRIAEYKKG